MDATNLWRKTETWWWEALSKSSKHQIIHPQEKKAEDFTDKSTPTSLKPTYIDEIKTSFEEINVAGARQLSEEYRIAI